MLDGDIDPELAQLLEAIGFFVCFAPRGSNVIRDDVKVLRLARKKKCILVCHDQHQDKETKIRLYPELYKRGGKILQIGGDSSQSILLALGKILIWYDQWKPWFESNDGKITLHKEKSIFKTALSLVNRVVSQQSYDIGQVLVKRQRKYKKRINRQKQVAPEQKSLNIE
jgi:hypothetical protein